MEWHQIVDPNSSELDRLAERYHLHPLHIEDCRHRNQSAKIEESPGYIFTVMKGVRLDEKGALLTADLDIFIGTDFVITVLEDRCRELETIVEQVSKTSDIAPRADQIYYRILDQMVDTYLPVLDHFDETIDRLEDQALEDADAADAGRYLRKQAQPDRAAPRAGEYTRRGQPLTAHRVALHPARHVALPARCLRPRGAQPGHGGDAARPAHAAALDVYLSSVANRTNQVMKVLTVLGTVALPSVVVSGIYGMNVKGLPGAESEHSLAIVFAVMVVTTAALLWLLKWFRWL